VSVLRFPERPAPDTEEAATVDGSVTRLARRRLTREEIRAILAPAREAIERATRGEPQ
jgi:hypothetical protein